MPCTCYVRYLTIETKFVLHNGAHNPSCPAYFPSLDPVDRAHDEEFRRKAEIETPQTERKEIT